MTAPPLSIMLAAALRALLAAAPAPPPWTRLESGVYRIASLDEIPAWVDLGEKEAALIVAAVNALPALLDEVETLRAAPLDVERADRTHWPGAVSDGLTLPCVDCGDVPRFDYIVAHEFWRQWVPGPERTGVICLPCLDKRCEGVGLAAALEEVQWTGTGHTVVLTPTRRIEYAIRQPLDVMPATDPTLRAKGDPMTILDEAPQIDAPIVLREQTEPDGSVSRVTVWLIGDGDESEEQIVVTETAIPLSWGGNLWHGYDKNGELVRILVNNHEYEQ